MSRAITVIHTGTANTASVVAALERAGCTVELTAEAGVAERAETLVLPGVGSFGAVAARLRAIELAAPLAARFTRGRPTLAICLGLQLLAEASEEEPSQRGLGVVPDTVTAFAPGLRTPQLGWNRVTAEPGCRLLRDGDAYFANSFKLDQVPAGWSGATAEHGRPFVAAIERGPLLACQFHPELSGPWGQALIERWLAAGEEVESC